MVIIMAATFLGMLESPTYQHPKAEVVEPSSRASSTQDPSPDAPHQKNQRRIFVGSISIHLHIYIYVYIYMYIYIQKYVAKPPNPQP